MEVLTRKDTFERTKAKLRAEIEAEEAAAKASELTSEQQLLEILKELGKWSNTIIFERTKAKLRVEIEAEEAAAKAGKLTPTPGIVTFTDSNLERAIRDAIGKPTEDIYQSDLYGLILLDLGSSSIIKLSGIEHCTNLGYLKLSNNQISDISALSGLTEIWYLDLANNQINNISPLSGLTNLQGLFLNSNQISDIQSLVNNFGLASGDYVDLSSNPLSATSIHTYIPTLQGRGVTVD